MSRLTIPAKKKKSAKQLAAIAFQKKFFQLEKPDLSDIEQLHKRKRIELAMLERRITHRAMTR